MSWIDEGVNLLLDGHTPKAIAKKLKLDELLVLETFEKLGLSDYKAFKISKPQETIYEVCCKTFGKSRVKQEFYLENNSRADIVVPDLFLVVEYHGVQHFKFIEFFHRTLDNFNLQKQADKRKEAFCKDNGWIYVVFTPDESLDAVTVKRKIVKALLAHAVEDPRPMNKQRMMIFFSFYWSLLNLWALLWYGSIPPHRGARNSPRSCHQTAPRFEPARGKKKVPELASPVSWLQLAF